MISLRDKALAAYMQTTHNVIAPGFRLQPMDSTAVQSYKGHHRYTISLEVDGEIVEVNASDSTSTAPAVDPAVDPATVPAPATATTPAPATTPATSL